MKTLKFISLFLLSTVIMTNASAVAISSTTNSAERIKPAKVFYISVKESEFTVTLPRNATTGYTWILKNPDVYAYVELVDYKYERNEKDGKLVGSGGQDVWRFRGRLEYFKAPITYQLQFIYAQPWELKVAKTNVVNVVTVPG